MAQRQKERHPHDNGDAGADMVAITVTDAQGRKVQMTVKRGTRVKDFLKKELKHTWRPGLTYKLNNRLLKVNKETGELTDDELGNPVLEENSHLLISQQFTGGCEK